MKKLLAGIILGLFCCMVFGVPIAEAKTNYTRSKKVSAYVKTKNGGHKHVNYTRKQHYKK